MTRLEILKSIDESELRWAIDCPYAVEAKGADQEQKNLAATQANFYNSIIQQQQAQFAAQTDMVKQLEQVWGPIFNAGPSQKGFSAEQEQNLRAGATEATGAEYKKAATAYNADVAARGGGNVYIPSGQTEAIRGQIASAAAADSAAANRQITQANYDVGRQNWLTAGSALSGPVLGSFNPTGFAEQATGAGSAAFNSATTIYNENKAASPWAAIGGLIGGAASSFLGPLAGGAANKVLGMGGTPGPNSPVWGNSYGG